MSRITIYLPPRLKAAVKAANLHVSAICQDALSDRLVELDAAADADRNGSQDGREGAAVKVGAR